MKKLMLLSGLIAIAPVIAACGSKTATASKVIKSAPVGNNLTATLSNKDGVLKNGDNEFFITFKDGSGKAVEVGAVALNFYMPAMGTMPAMNNAAVFTSTGTQGMYQGKMKLESAGDWQAQVSYEGAAGKGRTSITVTAH